MAERVALRPWGNSQGIRIPKSILEKIHISAADQLQIEVVEDAIVIKKVFRHKSFEERVAEYGGEISVGDFDWGEPQGRELL